MIDIECHDKALKATEISPVMNSGQQAWAFLGRYYLSKVIKENTVIKIHFNWERNVLELKTVPNIFRQNISGYNDGK